MKTADQYLQEYSDYINSCSIEYPLPLFFSPRNDLLRQLTEISKNSENEKHIRVMFRELNKAWEKNYPDSLALSRVSYLPEKLNFWLFFEYLVNHIIDSVKFANGMERAELLANETKNAISSLESAIKAIKPIERSISPRHQIFSHDIFKNSFTERIDENNLEIQSKYWSEVGLIKLLRIYKKILEENLERHEHFINYQKAIAPNNTNSKPIRVAAVACDHVLTEYLNAHLYGTAGRIIGFALNLAQIPGQQEIREYLRKR